VLQAFIMNSAYRSRINPGKKVIVAVSLLLFVQLIPLNSASSTTIGMLDPAFGTGGTYTRSLTASMGDSYPLFTQAVTATLGGWHYYAGKSTVSGTETNCLIGSIPENGAYDPGNRVGMFRMMKSATTYSWCEFLAVGIDSTGRVIAAGYAFKPFQNYECVIARFASNGNLDATFGDVSAGAVRKGFFSISGKDSCEFKSIAVNSADEIFAAGVIKQTNSSLRRAFLAKVTTSGVLDTSFSTDGLVEQDFGVADSESYLNEVHMTPDGKVLTVGTTSNGNTTVVSHFNSNGSLDNNFGTAGAKVIKSIADNNLSVRKTIVDISNSKIYLYTSSPIQRLNISGSLDTTFNDDGEIFPDNLGFISYSSVIRSSSDEFYVLGKTNSTPAVAKLISTGALDAGFGVSGIRTFGSSNWEPLALHFDLSGDIYASGRLGLTGGTNDAQLFGARILTSNIAAPSTPVLTISATTASNYTIQIDSGTKPTTVASYSVSYSEDGSTFSTPTTETIASATIPIEATNVRVITRDIYGQDSTTGTLTTPTPTPSPSASASSSASPSPTPTVIRAPRERVITIETPNPEPIPSPQPSLTSVPSPQPSQLPNPVSATDNKNALKVIENNFIQAPPRNLPALDFLILSTTRNTSVSKALPFSFTVSTSQAARPIVISMKLPSGQIIEIRKGKTAKGNLFKLPPIQFKSAGTYSLITKIGNKSKTVKIVVTE
jgi:uncharacterized delta-60 repeat protein